MAMLRLAYGTLGCACLVAACADKAPLELGERSAQLTQLDARAQQANLQPSAASFCYSEGSAQTACSATPGSSTARAGTSWHELTPAVHPSPRQRHALAAHRDRVYLFGGAGSRAASASSALGDTCEWDGSQWRQVFTNEALPAPSYKSAMASFRAQLVLFSSPAQLHIWDGQSCFVRRADESQVPLIEPVSAVELTVGNGLTRLVVTGRGYGPSTSSEWDGESWSGSIGLSLAMGPLAAQGDTLVSLAGSPLWTWVYTSR